MSKTKKNIHPPSTLNPLPLRTVPINWSPISWKKKKTAQQPTYSNTRSYRETLDQLAHYPPLVSPGEIEKLRSQIAEAAAGKRFILQGGDCAERFSDCTPDSLLNKLKILLEMSVILTYGARKPVVRIGRLAGQFAKPRSQESETLNQTTLSTYRGDSINAPEFTNEGRAPDPQRLLKSYFHSAVSLNYIRAMIDGGFADLHHPDNWNLHSIEKSFRWKEYEAVTKGILDAINFMESFGGLNSESLGKIDFFTSHEGLHLDYETTMTRKDSLTGKIYNQSSHMLWIGERTRQYDGGHVEYFRGLANPIGIKFGCSLKPDELLRLMDRLDPENLPGRLTLISRLGHDQVEKSLPQFLKAVKREGRTPAWSCDPMHGNTTVTSSGIKTRNFNHILKELKTSFQIHKTTGTILAGVHFELTGEDVTECTGGAEQLRKTDLTTNYASTCDPRLNYSQSLEIAFLIAMHLKKGN